MSDFDAEGMAARAARLIHDRFGADLDSAARALEVDASELRSLVEGHPTHLPIDVLWRIVRYFGVDATWLVTGHYDWRTHMRVLEAQEDGRDEAAILLRLAGRADAGPRVIELASKRGEG